MWYIRGGRARDRSRPLGIPTVLIRFIQQAIAQVIQQNWEHRQIGPRPVAAESFAGTAARLTGPVVPELWTAGIGSTVKG